MNTFLERRAIPRTSQLTLVRIPDVMTICGLSRSSIYVAIKEQDFPRPIAIGGRSRAWIRHEVENWIGKRIRTTRGTETTSTATALQRDQPASTIIRSFKGRTTKPEQK